MVTPQYRADELRAGRSLSDCLHKSGRVADLALLVERRLRAVGDADSEPNRRAAVQAIREATEAAADADEAWQALLSAMDALARIARAEGAQ